MLFADHVRRCTSRTRCVPRSMLEKAPRRRRGVRLMHERARVCGVGLGEGQRAESALATSRKRRGECRLRGGRTRCRDEERGEQETRRVRSQGG
eukprot:3008882-Pleurochrysis_carterae.AAC.2